MRNFNNFRNLKSFFSTFRQNPNFQKIIQNPVHVVIGINTLLYIAWKLKGVSEVFLVKHFSFERFNIRNHRYHTFLTYAFSHYGLFSFAFNTLIMSSFGKQIINSHGNRVFWLLYLGGAISGGLFMQQFMPRNSIVIPQVGAGPALASLLTFYGLNNLHHPVMFFGAIPVKMWFILGVLLLSALSDPSKKDLGGILTGLMVYQVFKIRM